MTSTSPDTRTPPARPSVAVVGFQGFGNVGDEAILAGIERLLGDDAAVTTVFSGGRDDVVAFASADRVTTARHLPTLTAWRRLRAADAMLVSGGGLMNDLWLTVIPRYASWCIVARLAGCRVVWVGAGVGPIRRRAFRAIAGLAFRSSRLLTVRDAASERWIRRCWSAARVRQIPDPAFFQAMPAGLSTRRGGLAIIARGPAPATARSASPAADGAADPSDDPGVDARAERLTDALADVAFEALDRGERVALLSLHPSEDREFVTRLTTAIAARGAVLPVEWMPPDPATTMERLASFDAIVTVRLHGLILGALVGTPSVTIGYDAKVSEVAAQLGLTDVHVPLDTVSGEALVAALDRLRADTDRHTAMSAAVDAARARRPEVRAILLGAMRP